jgi:hypothetical protein
VTAVEAHYYPRERMAYGKLLAPGWYREELLGVGPRGWPVFDERGPFATREEALKG